MNINSLIKNAEICDPITDLTAKEKQEAYLKGKFAAIIFAERNKLNLTQSAFADYIGVSQSMVSKWEDGEYNFTLEKISEIAAKLNVTADIKFTPNNAKPKVIKIKEYVYRSSSNNYGIKSIISNTSSYSFNKNMVLSY